MKKIVVRFGALAALSAMSVVMGVTGCGSASTATSAEQVGHGSAAIKVDVSSAKATPGSIQTVMVTVTGSGIDPALSVQLVAAPNGFTGTVSDIAVGAGRTFHVEAIDATGRVLLSGDATNVTITPGDTAVVTVVLEDSAAPTPFLNTAPQITSASASSGSAAPGDMITLGVTAVDADGDALSYSWTATGGSFDDSTSASPVWTAPSGAAGAQTISVEVSDSHDATDGLSFTIDMASGATTGSASVTASVNHWPSVTNMLASPTRLDVGDTTQLSVTALDVEFDVLSYAWTSTCNGTFANASTQQPSFTLAGRSPSGACSFGVTVNDARGGHGTGTLGVHTGAPTATTVGLKAPSGAL